MIKYNELPTETAAEVSLKPLRKCKATIEYQIGKRTTVGIYSYVIYYITCEIIFIFGKNAKKLARLCINFLTGELNLIRPNLDKNYLQFKEYLELISRTCVWVPIILTHNPKEVLI